MFSSQNTGSKVDNTDHMSNIGPTEQSGVVFDKPECHCWLFFFTCHPRMRATEAFFLSHENCSSSFMTKCRLSAIIFLLCFTNIILEKGMVENVYLIPL